MKAYICDRCGQIMKEKPNKVVITKTDSGGHQKQLEDGKELFAKDYCEKCSNEILDFLGNKEAAVIITSVFNPPTSITTMPGTILLCNAKEDKPESPTKVEPKKKQDKIRTLDTGKVGALHKAGWTNKSIADEMSVTEEVIVRTLSK